MNTEKQYRDDLARRVAERLSVSRYRVEDMLHQSERLQQICDEYEACRIAAARWRSIETAGHSRHVEFEQLSVDLESEIERWVAEHMDDSPRNTTNET